MASHEHKSCAEDRGDSIRCAVLTVSDSRTEANDESGRLARELFEKEGYPVAGPAIVPNDAAKIRAAVEARLAEGAELVLLTGGTGVSSRDMTPDAVAPLVEKRLPGFGEIFRNLSMDEIGTTAMLSRAELGVTREGRVIVCVPGSRSAVRLAMTQVLLKELKHLFHEIRRYR